MSRAAEPGVLIAGGGIAGLEAALALADLVGDQARVSVLAPERDFFFKPLTVEEPFSDQPAERRELSPALAEIGVDLIRGTLQSVAPDAHRVLTASADEVTYDSLVVCVGGRPRPAYEGVETFWSHRTDLPVDELIHRARTSFGATMSFVVPPATSWSLPLYELALLFRKRSEQLGLGDLRLRFVTPEPAPLAVFGKDASTAVADLFAARRISIETSRRVVQRVDGAIRLAPQGLPLAGIIVSLPLIEGPWVSGLPADPDGFMPTDEYGRVEGVTEVYAAGDATDFPVKQGGIATQQADAAVEHIAARLGADVSPKPFRPIVRGRLITGAQPLNLRHNLTGGRGEGTTSFDYLWWPPQKVAGRYLSAWLGQTDLVDLEPPAHSLAVEAAWPEREGDPASA